MITTAGSKSFTTNILPVLADGQQQGLPWYDWVLIIIVIVLLLYFLWLWWRYSQRKKELAAKPAEPRVEAKVVEPEVKAPKPVAAAPVEPAVPTPAAPVVSAPPVQAIPTPSAPVKADDLTIIEGIGPKIASVLQAAGITSFAKLAQANGERLEQILHEAGLRLADPSTWGEQARLAGEGKMEELKTLQDSLKGGRQA